MMIYLIKCPLRTSSLSRFFYTYAYCCAARKRLSVPVNIFIMHERPMVQTRCDVSKEKIADVYFNSACDGTHINMLRIGSLIRA